MIYVLLQILPLLGHYLGIFFFYFFRTEIYKFIQLTQAMSDLITKIDKITNYFKIEINNLIFFFQNNF